MAVDFYAVLMLTKTANQDEVKRAYKKLAMKWHPDKNLADNKEAEAKFKQVCQAYDVLSDPQKRQIYDVYGEQGLNEVDLGEFSEEDLLNMWQRAFKKTNSGHGGKKVIAEVDGRLVCSLEELYNGVKRNVKVSRTVLDEFGVKDTTVEVLEISIEPGWKKGTKITFPRKGNQEPGCRADDLIIVVDEMPHDTFNRDRNDLLVDRKLTLREALTGTIVNLTTLDGRVLPIPVRNIVTPGYETVIPNEGMPIAKDPTKKGSLRIKFDVVFPSRLSAQQIHDLRRVLGEFEYEFRIHNVFLTLIYN